MGDSAARRVLVASNRGPVSYTQGDDGQLTAKRGGGGMVSGLSTGADSEDMLWVCAALSDGARPRGRPAHPAGAPAAAGGPERLQRGSELNHVVRAPHAVRHPEPAGLRTGV